MLSLIHCDIYPNLSQSCGAEELMESDFAEHYDVTTQLTFWDSNPAGHSCEILP